MEKFGTCKLCQNKKHLQYSHAIPDSYFRRIFRGKSGKGILIPDGPDDIKTSEDSWGTFQLCKECEILINEQYENYSIALLRDGNRIDKNNKRILFRKVDVERFYMFCVSILWRAVNSTHIAYKGAVMPQEFYHKNINEKIRQAILQGESISTLTISLRVSRLIDTTGRWTMKNLKNLILSPFHRAYGENRRVSVNFAIEGFLITFIMPGLRLKELRSNYIVRKSKNSLYVPYLCIHDDPYLKRMIDEMDFKRVSGKVRDSVLRESI